jgi:hypothetical protein
MATREIWIYDLDLARSCITKDVQGLQSAQKYLTEADLTGTGPIGDELRELERII